MTPTTTDREALRSEWETIMELRYDTMPQWWWNRAKRAAEFEAYLAARQTEQ